MNERREVPPPVTESGDRVQSRPYESDWAKLPREEVHGATGPGGGPAGTVDSGPTNIPLVVIAVGGFVAFSTFLFASPVPLVLGLLMVVGGAIWAGVRHERPGHLGGVGSVDVDERH